MGDNCWNVPWMGVRRPTARRVEIEGRPMNHPRHSDPAEQSAFMRLFYRNWRPTRLGQRVNRVSGWLSVSGCRRGSRPSWKFVVANPAADARTPS